LKISQNAELQRKFYDYKKSFPLDSLMTFPAFTSVSLDDKVADRFGDYVLFQFTRVRGVRIRALSALPDEAEVLVPPPSVYKIVAVAVFRGNLVVTLERVDCPLTYLAEPTVVAALPPAAPTSAAPAGDDVEEELQGLVSEMLRLKIGVKKACVALARALADEGVVTLEHVQFMQPQDARDIFDRAGFRQFQTDVVMRAFAPASGHSAAPSAGGGAGSSKVLFHAPAAVPSTASQVPLLLPHSHANYLVVTCSRSAGRATFARTKTRTCSAQPAACAIRPATPSLLPGLQLPPLLHLLLFLPRTFSALLPLLPSLLLLQPLCHRFSLQLFLLPAAFEPHTRTPPPPLPHAV